MRTIKDNCNNEIVIKKSKFITNLYKINDIDDIKEIIDSLKKEYSDASHICYAYIIDDIYKSNDDNEPSGTAGMPMLDVLCKRNLNHILAVTIRYFGGIKLGAGGLIRAYSKSVKGALANTKEIELIDTEVITITFKIDELKLAQTILKDYEIIQKEFRDTVTFVVSIPTIKKEEIITLLQNNNFKIKM